MCVKTRQRAQMCLSDKECFGHSIDQFKVYKAILYSGCLKHKENSSICCLGPGKCPERVHAYTNITIYFVWYELLTTSFAFFTQQKHIRNTARNMHRICNRFKRNGYNNVMAVGNSNCGCLNCCGTGTLFERP